eukprot:48703_1
MLVENTGCPAGHNGSLIGRIQCPPGVSHVAPVGTVCQLKCSSQYIGGGNIVCGNSGWTDVFSEDSSCLHFLSWERYGKFILIGAALFCVICMIVRRLKRTRKLPLPSNIVKVDGGDDSKHVCNSEAQQPSSVILTHSSFHPVPPHPPVPPTQPSPTAPSTDQVNDSKHVFHSPSISPRAHTDLDTIAESGGVVHDSQHSRKICQLPSNQPRSVRPGPPARRIPQVVRLHVAPPPARISRVPVPPATRGPVPPARRVHVQPARRGPVPPARRVHVQQVTQVHVQPVTRVHVQPVTQVHVQPVTRVHVPPVARVSAAARLPTPPRPELRVSPNSPGKPMSMGSSSPSVSFEGRFGPQGQLNPVHKAETAGHSPFTARGAVPVSFEDHTATPASTTRKFCRSDNLKFAPPRRARRKPASRGRRV